MSDCSCCTCAMTVSKLMYAWCHVMRVDLHCDHWLSDNYYVKPLVSMKTICEQWWHSKVLMLQLHRQLPFCWSKEPPRLTSGYSRTMPQTDSSYSSSSNLLRNRCMTSSSFQFLPLLLFSSAIYFPFIRSLSRSILLLPLVAFPSLRLPCVIGQGIIFSPCGFFYLSFFLSFFLT